MCHAHPPTLVRIKGTKNLLELLVRRPMKKENIGEEKREIVSKVNRCNWPDSWIDEKRYTGKMEKADNCRNSRYIQKPNPRGGRSNQCQSIERFILDRFPFSSFPSTVFNLPFPVETFSRRKTSSFILFPCPIRVVETYPRVAPSQSPSNRPLIRPKTRPSTASRVPPASKKGVAASCISSSLRTV